MSQEVLFTPIQIGARMAQNRFVINAMECNDADENGNPTEKTYRRYSRLFEGGAGVVFLEAITVSYESRARLHQLSIEPHNEKALTAFVREMKSINEKTLFVWQLTHSGELSNPDFSKRVCVKPLPGLGGELLAEEDVDRIIDQFVLAAKIAHNCGADGVDVKLCHGYLGSQILRPYNDRNWKYGGSWENRRRFAFEVYERIQKEINDPNFLVGSKISMWEGIPGGQGSKGPDTAIMDLTEPLDLIRGLEERGADFIMVSAGNPSLTIALAHPDKRIPDYVYLHHYFQQEAKRVAKKAVIIGSAYSLFRDGNNYLSALEKEKASLRYWGNKNIQDGVTDMIAIGRQSLADPYLPRKMMEGKEDTIRWCTLCDTCMELLIRQENTGCVVYEKEYAEMLRRVRKEKGVLKFKHT